MIFSSYSYSPDKYSLGEILHLGDNHYKIIRIDEYRKGHAEIRTIKIRVV